MGEKERFTVSVDEDVAEELEDAPNRSALVTRLLREYYLSGGNGPIGLEIKLRDLEQDISETLNERDRINRRLERLRSEKERVERELQERQEDREEQLRKAEQYVKGRGVDNPAVQNWAEKLGMPPAELVHQVEELEA